jgi:hypothetical protein
MVIKRVGPVSCAKIAATIYAVFGLLIGGVFSLIALAGGFASDTSEYGEIGAMLGVAAIIVFPIFYGALGFVGTLVAAWLYNFAAGFVGGIEIEVQ